MTWRSVRTIAHCTSAQCGVSNYIIIGSGAGFGLA
jgi:hypothetical protein